MNKFKTSLYNFFNDIRVLTILFLFLISLVYDDMYSKIASVSIWTVGFIILWLYTKLATKNTVYAKLIKKQVIRSVTPRGSNTTTSYVLTFKRENGEELILHADSFHYSTILENNEGIVTYRDFTLQNFDLKKVN